MIIISTMTRNTIDNTYSFLEALTYQKNQTVTGNLELKGTNLLGYSNVNRD